MGATVSHALSMTSPVDTRYENRPEHWNSSHLFTLNAVGSEISGAFNNGGGITFGLETNGSITAAAPAGAPSPINFSAGTTSGNIGSVVFSDSNGVGWGLNGSTITASYTQSTHPHSSLFFADSNGLNWGTNASSVTGSYTQSTHAHTSLSFSNLNGVSFGINVSTLTASVQTNYAGVGETVGTIAGTDLAMTVNTDGVSIGYPKWITTARGSTDAIGLNTAQTNVTWTVNSSGLSFNAGGYAGTSTTFNGANISGSMTHNTLGLALSLSVAAPGAAAESNAINLLGANTAGNTTVTGSTLGFSGINMTLSGTNNSVLNLSVPATSSIVGTSGLSISTAGSTISVLPVALSAWDPYPIISGTAVSSHAPASFWFSRMILDWDVAVSYANVLKSLNVSAPGMSSQNSSATNKFSYSHGLTLFTRQDFGANSSRMSQWTTASFGMTGSLSQSSSSASVALSWVTNSTGGTTSFSTTSSNNSWTNFFTGMQMFRIPLVTTMTPGEYFIGQAHSSTTATVGSNFTLLSVSNLHVAPASNTFATITSSGSLAFSSPDGLGLGVASAVTTNNTMAMSVVSAGTQNWWYMNFSNI